MVEYLLSIRIPMGFTGKNKHEAFSFRHLRIAIVVLFLTVLVVDIVCQYEL